MNFKTTYILFGVLIILFALMVGLMVFQNGGAGRDPDRLFPSVHSKEDKDKQLSSDDITRVVIQQKRPAGDEIVFERDGKHWNITSPRSLRAEDSRVSRLVDGILQASIDKNYKPENMKIAGLDSPSRVVTLHSKNRELTLTVGDSLPGSDGVVYVLSSDHGKNKPLAVSKRDAEAVLENLYYFRGKELLGEGTDSIISIDITQPKKDPVKLAKKDGRWRFVTPNYGDAGIDATWLLNVTNLRVDYKSEKENGFVKDGVTDLATVDKELPKAEQLRIEIGRSSEPKKSVAVVFVGKKVGNDYYAYAESGKSMDVVKVPAKEVEPFLALIDKPEALRDKKLLALAPGAEPDAIDVKNSYGTLEFRKPEGKTWELYRGASAVPIDGAEVMKLTGLISGSAVNFVDPKRRKELGLERPDAEVVKVWSDSLEKADLKKPGKPEFKKDARVVTELRFGNKEGDLVAVERVWGDDKAILMVPSSIVDQVRKRPLDYYDRSVPGYTTGRPDEDVTKLELTRDGEEITLTRDKKGDPWKFAKPEKLKGRTASEGVVQGILNDVNRLPVEKVEAEKAADLGTYDLAKPKNRVVVTMTKDKKDTTYQVDFGKAATGAKGFYAKVGGKDPIYVVEARTLDGLKKELRDTKVFDFDTDKVASVKLTGWKKLLGGAESRTLEKKDGKWVVAEKPGFMVDDAKVAQALEGLSRLHAEKFVTSGKGMTLNDDAMQIEVTLADKKKYELMLGAAEGNQYYATSPQMPGEVFMVSKELFEQARNSPGYFGK